MSRHVSGLRIALFYRLYLMMMRGESMLWLSIRRWLLDQMLGRKHRQLNIFPDVFIEGLERLTIGDNVSINRGCNLSGFGGLSIGNDVSIAHSTTVLTTEHMFSDGNLPIKEQPIIGSAVSIGNNVWIGARVCILAGVSLAGGTIVAAGAVVKQSVHEENCTVGGVPARIIKRRS